MFCKPKHLEPTKHIFVGNCGTALGLSGTAITAYFKSVGASAVYVPEHTSHVYASFSTAAEAEEVVRALNGRPSPELRDRVLTVRYSDVKEEKVVEEEQHVAEKAEDCRIPGLLLLHEFVTEQEEQDLLAAVDGGLWETLAKRRVQHFGYTFEYWLRNVDVDKPATPFPAIAACVAERLRQLPDVEDVDQLTVNEYGPGVGLSAHVDTHSAFTGAIVSLSLAGPAVMEFRREGRAPRALLLPARSLLVMAGEARYAWRHYIPHRRSDAVAGARLPRAPRRVSFTFRKVRGFPCECAWPELCDSQGGGMPPTRMATTRAANGSAPIKGPEAALIQAARVRCKGALTGASTTAPAPSAEDATRQSSSSCCRHGVYLAVRQDGGERNSSAGAGDGPASAPSCGGTAEVGGESTSRDCAASSQHQEAGNGCANDRGEQNGSSTQGAGVKPEADADRACCGGGAGSPGPPGEEQLARLEARHVHSVYDIIASHFSATRFAIWPKVRAFLESLPPGALVADVGCGNGKYFGVRPDLAILGSDRSPNLAEAAASRLRPRASLSVPGPLTRCDVAVADGLHLPYRSGCLDGLLCIAVLHHISSKARRVRLLAELARVLRPGACALVTVWASLQEEPGKLAKWERMPNPAGSSDGDSSQSTGGGDYLVPWHIPFHRVQAAAASAAQGMGRRGNGVVHQGNTQSALCANKKDGFADGTVDAAKNTVVFKRYYHLFDEGELDGLVADLRGIQLKASFYDKSNWCAVLEKL